MNKSVFLFLIFALMPFINAFPQSTICDSIFFEAGKSKITAESNIKLSKIPDRLKDSGRFEISLIAYQDDPKGKNCPSKLSSKRLEQISKFLINKNLGNNISDIRIVAIDSNRLGNEVCRNYKNRINICIQEKFPETEHTHEFSDEATGSPPENDTVINTSGGSHIKISGGSFAPFKISDYVFEIKELFTPDEFVDNNISTTTSDRKIIKCIGVIRVLAFPKNSSTSIPVRILKPIIILMPMDSSIREKMTVFYKANDSKSFLTWKKTDETVLESHYGGKDYYMISVAKLGWVMVGELVNSCNCCVIQTPRFQHQKMSIIYLDQQTAVLFDDANNLFMIPCAEEENGFRIAIIASDKKGRIYSLDKILSEPPANQYNPSIFKIRKRDYVRL